jgi:hypothetical protein
MCNRVLLLCDGGRAVRCTVAGILDAVWKGLPMGSSIAMLRSVQVIVVRRGRCRGTADEIMVKCCDCGIELLIERIDVSWFCAGKMLSSVDCFIKRQRTLQTSPPAAVDMRGSRVTHMSFSEQKELGPANTNYPKMRETHKRTFYCYTIHDNLFSFYHSL